MSSNIYQQLNLKEGASLDEIKAAFRKAAKTCHPDAVGHSQVNVDKFIKVQNAYQKLIKKAAAYNKSRRNNDSVKNTPPKKGKAQDNWRFINKKEIGLDVYLSIYLLKPLLAQEITITLPWKTMSACPRCLGQGRTLAKMNDGPLYRPCVCGKCGGSGSVEEEKYIEVKIHPEMIGKNRIRLRKAGLYNPKEAERGDMIIEATWVDKLTADN